MASSSLGGMSRSRAAKTLDEESGGECAELLPKDSVEKDRTFGCGWAMVCGPAMVASLADTDAGCLLVALESGAQHGYTLLPLQILLVPVLVLAQELTVRLGVHRRKGLTALIKEKYGDGAAYATVAALLVYCTAIAVSELSGLAGVAELWGAPRWLALVMAAKVLLAAGFGLAYRSLERFAIALGLFEAVFIVTMALETHDPAVMAKDMSFKSVEGDDVSMMMRLVVANIGAVVMPFMLFFQQSAVVSRRLKPGVDEDMERVDTVVGSALTQLIMVGALMTTAAARGAWKESRTGGLRNISSVVAALSDTWGERSARWLVSLAFVGAALCATFVVTLCAAWAVTDVLGLPYTPGDQRAAVRDAPQFYATYAGVILAGIAFLTLGINIVTLNVGVEMLGAVFCPPILYALYTLSTSEDMPEGGRVTGWHKVACAGTFTFITLSVVATLVLSITQS